MKYILFVATNQDMLLFKLLNFLGVLLTEACYCLQLYGKWDFRNLLTVLCGLRCFDESKSVRRGPQNPRGAPQTKILIRTSALGLSKYGVHWRPFKMFCTSWTWNHHLLYHVIVRPIKNQPPSSKEWALAQSTWDIPYPYWKIFLFRYQIFKSYFFCH